ncbi:MAG: DegV family EDD domain-containing protein, partial [Erysipelotrichaceae bacterium]|nr:DegV family EDD domain-containing protein [Erysipelotrichaceae bacterium]
MLNIVCDSSCDFKKLENDNPDVRYVTVPFVLSGEGRDFVDTDDLNIEEMTSYLESLNSTPSSACPAPGLWASEFEDYDETIALCISKHLSGSFNSVSSAKEMVLEEHPEKKIEIVDPLGTGPSLMLVVEKIADWAGEGFSYDEIVTRANELVGRLNIVFSLCSFENLVRNGRMNRIVGLIATKLNIWGIGMGNKGVIDIVGKAKGVKNMVKNVVEQMKKTCSDAHRVIISHCLNEETAEMLRQQISETFEKVKISVYPT